MPMDKSSLKIAIIGIRGIPSNYGGFETFAEELSIRLAKKGYDITVYCRSYIFEKRIKEYKKVKLVALPTIRHKYFDTVIHTFLCIIHSIFKKYNIILVCNAANSIFTLIPRIFGKKVIVNVDGIERRRKKWNFLGKLWYCFGEIFSCIFPNAIISDAKVIQSYYLKRYKKKSYLITYGANIEKVYTNKVLLKYGLKSNEYILYVSRLEPENNAHIVLKAFNNVDTNKKLVIVGGAPYSKKYIASLKNINENRIVFTGFVFGEGYIELQSNAYCYIQATEVGGTHPALIEAMYIGNCVIANETPENQEVLGNCGLFYKKNDIADLSEKIKFVLNNPRISKELGKKAAKRVRLMYSWESTCNKYEELFLKLVL